MTDYTSLTGVVLLADYVVRIGLAIRVVMRRLPVGVTLAWLVTLLAFPVFGALFYLLIGELRLGRKRAHMANVLRERYEFWLRDVRKRQFTAWSHLGDDLQSLARLAEQAGHFPALPGNRLELIADAHAALRRIIVDIDSARRSCHFEFYIWSEGGVADEVAEALMRAAARGVSCRVLLDAVGSHDFFESAIFHRLVDAGVQVREALPAGLIRMFFVRFDLRLHRKIVVIDGDVGYTGSLNLVDPDYFKISSGVGKWVDSVVRVKGPAVEAMAVAFLEDWELETAEDLENLRAAADIRALPAAGESRPTGKAIQGSA